MTRDFEGKTEQDAINQAIEALHIEREDFDVEILDNGKRGLFKKANVKIRVHIGSDSDEDRDEKPFIPEDETDSDSDYSEDLEPEEEDLEPNEELETKVCEFIDQMVSHMGYESKTTVASRKGRKVNLEIASESSNIIIGRKGKNLDAIQVLANVYAGKIDSERKIIVDSEGYRIRHEEQIIKSAYRTAMQVRKTGRSRLLEPMNPYERKVIHTTLQTVPSVTTKSEGNEPYRRVVIEPAKK